jgi:hypothetical protein
MIFIEEHHHIAQPHRGLEGDTPIPSQQPEPMAEPTRLVSIFFVGSLQHHYVRVAA